MNPASDADYRGFVDPLARPDIRRMAERNLTAKMLSEFMYEEMIRPEMLSEEGARTEFSLWIDGNTSYRFTGLRRQFFGFIRILPESVSRVSSKGEEEPDVQRFLLDLHRLVPFPAKILAPALHEVLNTLAADCHMLGNPNMMLAAEFIQAPEESVEGELFAHPWVVANKSRLGFSCLEYRRYAPESKQPFSIIWLAARRERTDFRCIQDLDYAGLLANVLPESELRRFHEGIEANGAPPDDYYLLPVHPWQFEQRVASMFAREFATRDLIYLGVGKERYLPQQSIRTLTNIDRSEAAHLKLAVSILNTSAYRGVEAERARHAPQLTQWLQSRVTDDDFLREECRLILLGEFASLHFSHETYVGMEDVPYQYTELLGVIFRENSRAHLEPSERTLPLAALLHRDRHGTSVLSALIAASGVGAEAWINRLLEKVLHPLLHFLYRYGFTFSPHGQNALIALSGAVPTRLVIKDLIGDSCIGDELIPASFGLPEPLCLLLDPKEPEVLIQWIQSGLFVGVFRYLTEILVDDSLMTEEAFWRRVLKTVQAYQEKFPELRARFTTLGLTDPVFAKVCLNRTRLMDLGYTDSTATPAPSVASMLDNPLFLINNDGETDTDKAPGFRPRHESLFERCVYSEHYDLNGKTAWVRPVDAGADTRLIHDWMNRPHVAKFWNQAWPLPRIREYVENALARPGFDPYLIYIDDDPYVYFEAYDPARDRLKEYYEAQEHDVGLHTMIGDERNLKRYTMQLATTLMRFVFTTRPQTQRIVGEPDERNTLILAIMRFLGFQTAGRLKLPEKSASLQILTRENCRGLADKCR